jgi:hypothetical protein
MPNKSGQENPVTPKSERKGRLHDSLLPLTQNLPLPEQTTASPTVSGSSAKQPEMPDEELTRWIGRIVLKWSAAAWDYAVGKWRPIVLGLVGATGLTTAVATIPPSQVRDMDGYVPVLKPQRECTAQLSRVSTAKEIDDFLADPKNYGSLEKDVWEISVNASGEFKGTQWLRNRGNSPMRVSGYMANGDWIDGAIRGSKGHGTYHLEARNNEETYRGTLTALDCSLPQDTVIVCPYTLVPKDTPEAEVGLAGRVCRRYYGAEIKADNQ